jgi:mitogen-activated protein kinase 1/3
VGSGAYGIVIGATDAQAPDQSKNKVAIKKIERCFEHRFYAKRTLRELKILRNLKHENVINFLKTYYYLDCKSTHHSASKIQETVL